ncbi:hypothetical protein J3R82DRAFT_6790 [Butyriboletus roseoflavus]|nr:hypothetical protein J3R82DRAFT_6790 [Butyriboletus roseoflavus]
MFLVIDPELLNTSTFVDQNKRKSNLSDEISAIPKKKKQMLMASTLDKAKYKLVGRKVVSLTDPFGSPRTAINVGLKYHSGCEGELDMESLEMMHQINFFHTILSHSQGLEDELKTIDASGLRNICSWITTGMSEQRSTNLGSVKHAGLTYVLPNHEVLEPPMQKREDKSGRGFNHPQITQMLCPRKKLISFDKDPDTMIGALQEGLIKMTASNWPTCFYEDGINDPENKAKVLYPSFYWAISCGNQYNYQQHIKDVKEPCMEPYQGYPIDHCLHACHGMYGLEYHHAD